MNNSQQEYQSISQEEETIIQKLTKVEEELFILEEMKEYQMIKFNKVQDNVLYNLAQREQKYKQLWKEYMKTQFTLV